MQTPTVETMLSDLNTNLATGKRSLTDMMDSGDYSYKMRDGSVIEIPEEQMETIWNVCDDSERLRLKLPIYISTEISGEAGAWKVDGKAEAAVVAKLTGRPMYREDRVILYFPDYRALKTMIPDAILMVFTP